MHAYMHVCIYVCMYICMHECMYTVCMYECMYVHCMCVCKINVLFFVFFCMRHNSSLVCIVGILFFLFQIPSFIACWMFHHDCLDTCCFGCPIYYMHVFCIFVFALVQRNWAYFTWKGTLEIRSLLSLLSKLTLTDGQGHPHWHQNVELSDLYHHTKFERNRLVNVK